MTPHNPLNNKRKDFNIDYAKEFSVKEKKFKGRKSIIFANTEHDRQG